MGKDIDDELLNKNPAADDGVDDDDDGGDDDGVEVEAKPKRNRWREMNERMSAAEARAEAADRAREEEARARREAMSLVDELRRSRQTEEKKGSEDDEYEAKHTAIWNEQSLLQRELQARGPNITPDEVERIEKRAKQLERERVELAAERVVSRRGAERQQQAPQTHPMLPMALAQYPDVMGNDRARGWAGAYHQQQVLTGRQDNWELAAESFEAARRAFKLGGPPSRSVQPQNRNRFAGAPAGAGGGGGDDSGGDGEALTKAQRAMANSMYSHLPDEAARIKKWRSGPGKQAAEELRKRA